MGNPVCAIRDSCVCRPAFSGFPNDRLTSRTAASSAYSYGQSSGFSPDSSIPAPDRTGTENWCSLFGFDLLLAGYVLEVSTNLVLGTLSSAQGTTASFLRCCHYIPQAVEMQVGLVNFVHLHNGASHLCGRMQIEKGGCMVPKRAIHPPPKRFIPAVCADLNTEYTAVYLKDTASPAHPNPWAAGA